MAPTHPDIQAEQAYLDHAYECLEATRRAANRMSTMVEVGRGGTNQARFERDAIWEAMASRLAQLDLGEAALCFGRIDTSSDESFYIGRVAVADENQEPVIVDWRAPVAEPFYRATGRDPMGLHRRRHFASRGRTLLGIEDELFGDAVANLGLGPPSATEADDAVTGYGALIAALETARTGRLTDIVATIQGEQDEIIRSPMPGVLVVQGGPGTGKTVVALHRAAYLLYTHRFPLEGQGVLVVGPNRLFLSYIEQVLPSLGEAGVELAVLADLVPDVTVSGSDRGLCARVKGDLRMAELLRRAVRQRQRPLRQELVVGFGLQHLRLSPAQSERIVTEARRRSRRHNAGRRHVEHELFLALARSGRGDLSPTTVREQLRSTPEVREALERMWPVLSPAELLHDLFGGRGLLRSAAQGLLEEDEWQSLYRPRAADAAEAPWTNDDAPLLDEARSLLGPKPQSKRQRSRHHTDGLPAEDEVRTYGHIVVDEAQDLSPMQLRVIARRSLGGSLTVVGDIAQATGQWAHADWDEILEHLPDRRSPHWAELTIGYRLPEPIMAMASRVLAEAAPGLSPPRSVRQDGAEPIIRPVAVDSNLGRVVVEAAVAEREAVVLGNVAVICAESRLEELAGAFQSAGVSFGRATRRGLDSPITLVPVGLVKGLEVDASVVVEPADIIDEQAQGARALYVALTRATKRLTVVHQRALPASLR